MSYDLYSAIPLVCILIAIVLGIKFLQDSKRGYYLSNYTKGRLKELGKYCDNISCEVLYPEKSSIKEPLTLDIPSKRFKKLQKELREIEYQIREYIIEDLLDSAIKDIQKGEDSYTYKFVKEKVTLIVRPKI